MLRYQLQARTQESGERWVPLVQGTLNQTGQSDEEASTFATEREADAAALEEPLLEFIESDFVLEWRIAEVQP